MTFTSFKTPSLLRSRFARFSFAHAGLLLAIASVSATYAPNAHGSVPSDKHVNRVIDYALYLSDMPVYPEERMVIEADTQALEAGRSLAEAGPDFFDSVEPADPMLTRDLGKLLQKEDRG